MDTSRFNITIALFLVNICLFPFSKQSGFYAHAQDYTKTPVLFVHGSGLDSGSWNTMISYLIGVGYPAEYLYAVNIEPSDTSNVYAAEKVIAPAIDNLLSNAETAARNAGYTGEIPVKVNMVAHSMGALSSRWYIVNMNPERVNIWISLGGANHGTNSLCGYAGEGNIEMCPAFATSGANNPLQIALNGTPANPVDETPYSIGEDNAGIVSVLPDNLRNILYFTLRIDPDEWIEPANSALIAGAGGITFAVPDGINVLESSPGNFLFLDNVEHDYLPQDMQVIRFVETLLDLKSVPVPVSLAYFNGTVMPSGQVVLEWKTLSEDNNIGFQVQRRGMFSDTFKTLTIPYIPGNGTSNNLNFYEYIDNSVTSGQWYYRLVQIDTDGFTTIYDEIQVDVVIQRHLPNVFDLYENFPNPFNSKTTLTYRLLQNHDVLLDVYSILGKKIKTLVKEYQGFGLHRVSWNGKDDSSNQVPSGLYFCRMEVDRVVQLKKMIVIK